MARTKDIVNAVPTQFKHLRYADIDVAGELSEEQSIEIYALGGFTLAYRAVQRDIAPGQIGVHINYAFSECMRTDNFNKKDGRARTYHRLQGNAANFTNSFDITDVLPANFIDSAIVVSGTIIDFPQSFFNVQRAVVEHFLEFHADQLNVGTSEPGEGNLLENLFEHDGVLYLNADVLDYEEPTIEELIRDVAATITQVADSTIDAIDQTDVSDPNATAIALQAAKKALTDIKELVATAAADEDDDSDEDEEEGDDEEESESEEE